MPRKRFSDLTRCGRLKRLKIRRPTFNYTSPQEFSAHETQFIAPPEPDQSQASDALHNSEAEASNDPVLAFMNRPVDSDDSITDDSVTDDSDTEILAPQSRQKKISEALRNWAIQFNISHIAVTALLCILRLYGFGFLPQDSRTLMKTPSRIDIQTVSPGHYCHLGIRSVLEKLLSNLTNLVDKIELLFGIDGLLLFKSSTGELWPIMMAFLNVPSLLSKVSPVGIYYGKKKPSSNQCFLEPFVSELKTIIEDGILLNNKKIAVFVKGFCCDTPAKSFILGTKGHAGYYSCTKCKQSGDYFHSKITFPDIPLSQDELEPILRTSQEFLNREDEEFHIGTTPLIKLPNLNFISGFPLDYMHLVCLGVTRTLMSIWIFGKVPLKMPFQIIDLISSKLIDLQPHIPLEFARKPRSLKELSRWKATEFRQFLLYTGPLILKTTLLNQVNQCEEIYDAFLCLHIGMRILLDKRYCMLQNAYARDMLRRFLIVFKSIYGQQYMTSNFHGLIHLNEDAFTFGPLDNCSAFKFENYLWRLKNLVRKNEKPLQQIVKRIQERIECSKIIENKTIYPQFLKKYTSNSILLDDCDPNQQFEEIAINENTSLSIKPPNNTCYFDDGVVGIITNIVFSNDFNEFVVVFKSFNKYEEFFDEPYCKSSSLGIQVVSGLTEEYKIRVVSDIAEKLVVLPMPNNKFLVLPLLH